MVMCVLQSGQRLLARTQLPMQSLQIEKKKKRGAQKKGEQTKTHPTVGYLQKVWLHGDSTGSLNRSWLFFIVAHTIRGRATEA